MTSPQRCDHYYIGEGDSRWPCQRHESRRNGLWHINDDGPGWLDLIPASVIPEATGDGNATS